MKILPLLMPLAIAFLVQSSFAGTPSKKAWTYSGKQSADGQKCKHPFDHTCPPVNGG